MSVMSWSLLVGMASAGETIKLDIAWQSFVSGRTKLERAALMLPAKIDGVTCLVQLDTGANYAFMPSGAWAGRDASRAVAFELASLSRTIFLSEQTLAQLHERRACGIVGRVGNALFSGGTVTLDLKRQKFTYQDGAALRDDSAAAPFHYIQPAGWEGGFIVVDLRLPTRRAVRAMLDTGAAPFTFTPLTIDLYEALRTGGESRIRVPSLSATIECRVSDYPASIAIGPGTQHMAGGLLGFCGRPAPNIGVALDGIVGLAGFVDQVLVIDYRTQRWRLAQEAEAL